MAEPHPLAGTLVGLSVSDSPDLRELGLSRSHIRHTFIELARQLLAAGANLGYGGDLRSQGFTEMLIDLLRTYSIDDRPDRDRIRFYLAWPTWDNLPANQRAELRTMATIVATDRADDHAPAITPGVDDRVRVANSLTLMRRRMTADIDARIVLGGQTTSFIGCYPGVAEETVLAIRAAKPVFVLGGFGGCAQKVAELIQDTTSTALTIDTLRRTVPGYAELIASIPDVTDEALTATIREAGVDGLRNGLSAGDNRVLFESSDVDVVTALMLRGMRAVAHRGDA